MPGIVSRGLAGCAAVLFLGACSDRSQPLAVSAPQPSQPAITAALECRANLHDRTVKCGQASLPAAVRGYVVVGDQHKNVDVISSNLQQDVPGEKYTFDVTVKNLIAQPMATVDGVTPDTNGVRLIFDQSPTVTDGGNGQAYMLNPDGEGTFTASGQPYYRYAGTDLGGDGILTRDESSATRSWAMHVDAGVNSVVFRLWVVAEVPDPQGYVDIYGGVANLLSGTTVALGDTVRTFVGDPDSAAAAVVWTTSDSAVATVDVSGTVTGVGAGTAVITASSGPRTGSTRITVCPRLAVGEVYTATMPGAANLCFGGYGSKAEFTYTPVNLSTSSALSLTVTGTGVGAGADSVSGPPSPIRMGGGSLLMGAPAAVPAGDLDVITRDAALYNRLARNPASRIGARSRQPSGRRGVITSGVVPAVGDSMDLNTAPTCSGSPVVRRGLVRSVKQHVIIVSDTSNPAGGFTTAQYDSIALEFDSIAFRVDSANFGEPFDADQNGHVVVFYTRAINELSPPATSSVGAYGYFYAKDLFSSDPVSGCANSNEGEILYMLVPDPTGAVNSNVRQVSTVRSNTSLTLGHNLQHLINASRRLYVLGGAPLETGWLNEGLSHVAEELMFYRTASGLAPRQNLVVSNVNSGPLASRRVAAYNTYANPNMNRLHGWMLRPDTTGAFKQDSSSLAVRGTLWAFLRYASDRVNGSDAAFWYSLVNTTLTGKVNVQNAIGGANPDLWLRDWITAMYADDNAFTVDTQYRNPSWNYRAFMSQLFSGASNPNNIMQTRKLSPGAPLTLSYAAGGGTTWFRFSAPASAFATITALSGGAVPTSPFALTVVRTK